MDKIKKIIIVIILIILVLSTIIILIVTNGDNIQNEGYLKYGEDPEEEIEENFEPEFVQDRSRFCTVENSIQYYYDLLNNESSSFYIQNDNGDLEKSMTNEEINQMRLDLLSEKYIQENGINLENINEYIETNDEKSIVIALQMKELVSIPISKYIVYGYIVNLDYEVISDFCLFVNLDVENHTFSIEPISNNYNNIDEIEFENENNSIDVNDNNNFIEDNVDYEEFANKYFINYKIMMLSSPKLVYNNYFSQEYRDERFGSLSKFVKYIEDNRDEIENIRLESYLVNNYDDYTQFVCKDQYENIYVFNEKIPMQFTLQLDTYIINTDKFSETYEKSEDEKKVQMNIDKFFQMINRHDYRTSYNCLADGFKNNYFNTEEEFEEYAKDRFFTYNKIKFTKYEKKGNGLYIFDVELKDLLDEDSETRKISIIMKLEDELSFKMSFDM